MRPALQMRRHAFGLGRGREPCLGLEHCLLRGLCGPSELFACQSGAVQEGVGPAADPQRATPASCFQQSSPEAPSPPTCADTWIVVDGEEMAHRLTFVEVHPSLCRVIVCPRDPEAGEDVEAREDGGHSRGRASKAHRQS